MLRAIIETLLMYSDDDTTVIIGAVDRHTADALGVRTGGVWIGVEYIKKLVRRHRLTVDDIEQVVESFNYGTLIREAENRFSVLVQDDQRRWWVAGLKPERNKDRVLISTIHRSQERQVSRKRRKHLIIRD